MIIAGSALQVMQMTPTHLHDALEVFLPGAAPEQRLRGALQSCGGW